MKKVSFRKQSRPSNGLASFTIVELLVVMAIIAVLIGLTLAAGTAVMNNGMRSRANAEIAAMSTALEGYKTDNGIYPSSDGTFTTNTPYYSQDASIPATLYVTNATLLYIALSGQTNQGAALIAGAKTYMSFKPNQINTVGSFSYVKDPWGYPYGYSTGNSATTNYPFNGPNFFDLWSTGGKKGTAAASVSSWLINWQ